MTYLRIIGDVHGNMDAYIEIASQSQYSIQLGDMGFSYEKLHELDPAFHKVLGGNHDNYQIENGKFVKQTPHFLGDYGVYEIPKLPKFFFVRGGYSIDRTRRREFTDWWVDEQLTYASSNVGTTSASFVDFWTSSSTFL